MKKLTYFLDMDGVVVDFIDGFAALYGKRGHEYSAGEYDLPTLTQETWEQIIARVNACNDFWFNLKAHPWAMQLVTMLRRRGDLYILSSPGSYEGVRDQKTRWVSRNLGLSVEDVILTGHKHLLAGQDRVLVDDLFTHCHAWNIAGGKSIVFPAYHNSIITSDPIGYMITKLDEIQRQSDIETIQRVRHEL